MSKERQASDKIIGGLDKIPVPSPKRPRPRGDREDIIIDRQNKEDPPSAAIKDGKAYVLYSKWTETDREGLDVNTDCTSYTLIGGKYCVKLPNDAGEFETLEDCFYDKVKDGFQDPEKADDMPDDGRAVSIYFISKKDGFTEPFEFLGGDCTSVPIVKWNGYYWGVNAGHGDPIRYHPLNPDNATDIPGNLSALGSIQWHGIEDRLPPDKMRYGYDERFYSPGDPNWDDYGWYEGKFYTHDSTNINVGDRITFNIDGGYAPVNYSNREIYTVMSVGLSPDPFYTGPGTLMLKTFSLNHEAPTGSHMVISESDSGEKRTFFRMFFAYANKLLQPSIRAIDGFTRTNYVRIRTKKAVYADQSFIESGGGFYSQYTQKYYNDNYDDPGWDYYRADLRPGIQHPGDYSAGSWRHYPEDSTTLMFYEDDFPFLIVGLRVNWEQKDAFGGLIAKINSHWLPPGFSGLKYIGGSNKYGCFGLSGDFNDEPYNPPTPGRVEFIYKGREEEIFLRNNTGEKEIKLPISFRCWCVNKPTEEDISVQEMSENEFYGTSLRSFTESRDRRGLYGLPRNSTSFADTASYPYFIQADDLASMFGEFFHTYLATTEEGLIYIDLLYGLFFDSDTLFENEKMSDEALKADAKNIDRNTQWIRFANLTRFVVQDSEAGFEIQARLDRKYPNYPSTPNLLHTSIASRMIFTLMERSKAPINFIATLGWHHLPYQLMLVASKFSDGNTGILDFHKERMRQTIERSKFSHLGTPAIIRWMATNWQASVANFETYYARFYGLGFGPPTVPDNRVTRAEIEQLHRNFMYPKEEWDENDQFLYENSLLTPCEYVDYGEILTESMRWDYLTVKLEVHRQSGNYPIVNGDFREYGLEPNYYVLLRGSKEDYYSIRAYRMGNMTSYFPALSLNYAPGFGISWNGGNAQNVPLDIESLINTPLRFPDWGTGDFIDSVTSQLVFGNKIKNELWRVDGKIEKNAISYNTFRTYRTSTNQASLLVSWFHGLLFHWQIFEDAESQKFMFTEEEVEMSISTNFGKKFKRLKLKGINLPIYSPWFLSEIESHYDTLFDTRYPVTWKPFHVEGNPEFFENLEGFDKTRLPNQPAMIYSPLVGGRLLRICPI